MGRGIWRGFWRACLGIIFKIVSLKIPTFDDTIFLCLTPPDDDLLRVFLCCWPFQKGTVTERHNLIDAQIWNAYRQHSVKDPVLRRSKLMTRSRLMSVYLLSLISTSCIMCVAVFVDRMGIALWRSIPLVADPRWSARASRHRLHRDRCAAPAKGAHRPTSCSLRRFAGRGVERGCCLGRGLSQRSTTARCFGVA